LQRFLPCEKQDQSIRTSCHRDCSAIQQGDDEESGDPKNQEVLLQTLERSQKSSIVRIASILPLETANHSYSKLKSIPHLVHKKRMLQVIR